MKLEISNMIKLPKDKIKSLNYQNYIYTKLGKYEEFVHNFWFDKDYYYFPRNINKFLKNWKGEELEFFYNTISKQVKNKITLSPDFKLRDYQEKAVNQILENFKNNKNDVLLLANTGAGKSYLTSYIITKLQKRTLILTDMTMLSEQMYNEISLNTNADVQIVNGKSTEVKDVNIVTYQLLNKNPKLIEMFKNEIGLIIADEIQNTGAESVKTIVQQFSAKYRLGLSATPTRSDGLTEVIYDVYPYIVKAKGISIPVELHFVKEMEIMLNPMNYRKNLYETIETEFIPTIDIMVDKLVDKLGKSIMIAVDNKEIQKKLKEKYKKYGVAILNSQTSPKERQQILKDYEDEKIKILLGYKVLNKGISIPRMEVLINLFAATTKENLEQLIGRLMRTHPKKEKAVFVDFAWGLNMYRQFNVKTETYQKLYREEKIKAVKNYSHRKYRELLKSI